MLGYRKIRKKNQDVIDQTGFVIKSIYEIFTENLIPNPRAKTSNQQSYKLIQCNIVPGYISLRYV